jgi:hypothetical protein
MSVQQIIEMLAKAEADRKAYQEKMATDRKAEQETMATNKEDLLIKMETLIDAYHEKRMTMFDAYEKRMMVCLGQTEATESIKPDPGLMQPAEEHQDNLSEDVVVRPVKGLKKRRRA